MPEPSRRDRVAFVLLAPSLVVPIAALALVVWRQQHAYDQVFGGHVDMGFFFYFPAGLVLSAVLFSMSINAVLAVRQHADFETRSIPSRTLALHFAVAVIVAVWALEFTALQLQMEGFLFGIALGILSVLSFVRIGSHSPIDRQPILPLRPPLWTKAVLLTHPALVAAAAAATLIALQLDSDLYLVSLALLAILGLPLSGIMAVLWLPLSALALRLEVPIVFLCLALVVALLNSVLTICVAVSPSTGARIVNRALNRV